MIVDIYKKKNVRLLQMPINIDFSIGKEAQRITE